MRLIPGTPRSSTDPGGPNGRLELYYNRKWGTICDKRFTKSSADVVCQQLGYDRAYEYGTVLDLGFVNIIIIIM